MLLWSGLYVSAEKNKSTSLEVLLWSGLRVSAEKTTECCFFKRCETKQGARQAADLRRRRLATMRLEGISNFSSSLVP